MRFPADSFYYLTFFQNSILVVIFLVEEVIVIIEGIVEIIVEVVVVIRSEVSVNRISCCADSGEDTDHDKRRLDNLSNGQFMLLIHGMPTLS